jgi:hypothetical protein
MTRQESFKRRIRARMAETGERYNAARRTLIEQSPRREPDDWVSPPEMSDEAVRAATGRAWDEWWKVIDAWPADGRDHAAIATWIQEAHGIDGWWAQTVTVGYERITGRRLPHQMADGTFTANKSRTVGVDADDLRALLLDDDGRHALFGGLETQLRSRPSAKAVRLVVGPGTALLALEARPDGRTKVTVAHGKLPDHGDVDHWKAFWSEWLDALDDL